MAERIKCWKRIKRWISIHSVMGFHLKLVNNYNLGISGFHKIRQFKDGVSFFEFTINLDLFKDDHNPQFRIMLIILNIKIFELEVYTC